METIVTTALVGTGRQSSLDITTGTAIDDLASQLAREDTERKILLMAGALAFYRQAGQVAAPAPTLPEPAGSETLRPCSAARILSDLLRSEHNGLLPDAYALLEKAQLHLPFELLPEVLAHATRDHRIRASLLPVLGERGYWLCQFNPSWSWVNQLRLEAQPILPTDLETLWQEGTLKQRVEVLQRVRKDDPAQGLEWLKAVWKKEKVDVRAELLGTFSTGLSMADYPFLERALDDRGDRVRYDAARLLTRLVDSPQALRLRARAEAQLQYEDGKLMVTLPDAVDEAWMYDVEMVKSAAQSSRPKSYWLSKTLSRVPPSYWEERFSATPIQILDALRASEWSSEVANALTDATFLFPDADWFSALIDWYAQKMEAGTINTQEMFNYDAILARLPQKDAEQRVLRQLALQDYAAQSVGQLSHPWSDEFGAACIQSLKDHYHTFHENQTSNDQWASVLNIAAVSLAPSNFDAALTGWNFSKDDNNNIIHYWNTQLSAFLQKIRVRKSLLEEIR